MKVQTEAAFEKLITEHLILHGGYEFVGWTSEAQSTNPNPDA